jgi:hypothetical protein
MKINDIAVKVEDLREVRGGANIAQGIYNGATTGFSVAVGGGVGSPTTSTSEVLSAHVNRQSATASDVRARIMDISVAGSQNVLIGGRSLFRW